MIRITQLPLLVFGLLLAASATQAELPNFDKAEKAAGFTPIQIALAAPIQIAPETWDVTGLRLNIIYGRNLNTSFVDIGLLNQTRDHENGIMVGALWNGVAGEMSGVQVAGLLNNSGSSFMMEGIQVGSLNICGDGTGMQVGAFNSAKSVQGMQIGVFNYTEGLNGLQIGLININSGGQLPFMPILNIGF